MSCIVNDSSPSLLNIFISLIYASIDILVFFKLPGSINLPPIMLGPFYKFDLSLKDF